MRTLRNQQLTFSADRQTLDITMPTSWRELTQEQLRYVLGMMATRSNREVKVMMLLRFCGINIESAGSESGSFNCYHLKGTERENFTLQGWQMAWMMKKLAFIDRYEDYDVRLDGVGSLRPVDGLLHGVPFKAYLAMEKYYQGFLRNKDNTALLERLGQLMYVTEKGEYEMQQKFGEAERLNCFLWYSYIKKEFGKMFPHFFRPSSGIGGTVTEYNIISQMNVQIRALTGGDITKEETIMNSDCWRALTELDAKAREAEELKKTTKKK